MFGLPSVLGLKSAAIAGAIALLVGAAGGVYAGYKFELGRYEGLVAADAQAMAKAVEHAADVQRHIDIDNQGDAIAQAYFKGKMDATTVTIKMGVPANVTIQQDQLAASTDHAGCVTYGFVRVLVAGERLVSPDSLDYPSGESADSCTGYEPSVLATALAQDLSAGAGAGHQLDSLIAAVKRNDATATAAP